MALVVGTNSYTDRTYADAYLLEIGENTVWDTKTDPEQDSALIKATQYMEGLYFGRWIGTLAVISQALSFPRDFITDKDGRTYANNLTPDEIQNACSLYALQTFTADLLITEEPTGVLIEEEVAGVIKQKWAEGFETQQSYPQIENVFIKFLVGSSNIIQLVK